METSSTFGRIGMEKIIAYCGIICSECPTFIATQKNNDEERKKVAELWSKQYGREFKIEDINCDGCLTKGPRVLNYCNICEIRKCGREKNVENCAYCEDYACEKLSKFFDEVKYQKPKKVLDTIRQQAHKK
jgi:hypothetical protein